ncbi:MAG TPA: S1 RNA-binding domain-containing protein [Bellilinea sp.]|jgi:small subunit ribosomal protein S1|nr:S1 RNA-binding domain-containing protein [Bellilinea sp.]
MVTKRAASDLEEARPDTFDEGWWAAVLSDEESYLPTKKETTTHTSVPAAVTVVDWDFVKSVYERDEIVALKVQGFNRGGLLVQGKGIQGFVPVSHLIDMPNGVDEEERRNILINYVDRMIDLKVIECEPEQERIVLSERAALAGEGQRKVLFESLSEGAVLSGRVTNVTDFGVFIDLGGVEGLIHVSELSWGRVQHPGDVLHIDQEVRVLVLQVSEENSRIALSLKRLSPNPWESLSARYKPGDVVAAKVTSVTRFGAFARLEEGVEGLVHISSIKLPAGYSSVDQFLTLGQAVNVRILHIDIERRRLGLGLIQPE